MSWFTRRGLELVPSYANLGFRSIVSYAVMLGKEYRAAYGAPSIQAFGEALQQVMGPVTVSSALL